MTGAPSTCVEWVGLPGGDVRLGSDDFYPEESPVVERTVRPFSISRTPVTNAQFAQFIRATSYVTTAEQSLSPREFPHLSNNQRAAGSLVFTPTLGPVDLTDWKQWWAWVQGAHWRAPSGPGSSIEGKDDHPVVQVSYLDVQAYCSWAEARLPTEEEWEYAARGGLEGATYAWGDESQDEGALKANTWQGVFPYRNTGANGWVGTSPVGVFPPNGFGLLDVTGNVWEWTSSPWSSRHASSSCSCSPSSERAVSEARVVKGGSHLCAPEYCLRYRPAARTQQTPDSSTTHLGFRIAR